MRFEGRRLQWLAYLFYTFIVVFLFVIWKKTILLTLNLNPVYGNGRKQKHRFDTVCHCGVTTYWPVCGVLLILIHYLHMYFRFSHNSFIILVLLSSVNSESNLFMQLVVFFVFKESWVLTVSMLLSSITRSCEKALFRCLNLGPVSQTYPDWSGLYFALSLMLNVKTLFTKTKEG